MTMSEFVPDKTLTVKFGGTNKSISIKQRIIPDSAVAFKYVSSWCQQGWKMKPCKPLSGTGKPKGICIHNTEWIKTTNPDLAQQYAFATWPNCNMGGTMVHYYVYKTSIWQILKETEQGWHAADGTSRRSSHRPNQTIGGNVDCISIECVYEDASGKITTSEESTAALTAYLCYKYDLDPNLDIYTHNYFYSKKYCPAMILPHWAEFIGKVNKYYTVLKRSDTKADTKFKVGDIVKFNKGCIEGLTPIGDHTTTAESSKYGTIKEVHPQYTFRYRVGKKYYREEDLSIYEPKDTSTLSKFKVGDVLYMKKGTISAENSDGTGQQLTAKNQYGTCKNIVKGAKFAYYIGKRYYKENDLTIYTKKDKTSTSSKPTSFKKGDIINLNNANLYGAAVSLKASKKISGKYYVYDGIMYSSGKIRICPNSSDVGAKPASQHVTGYINTKEL